MSSNNTTYNIEIQAKLMGDAVEELNRLNKAIDKTVDQTEKEQKAAIKAYQAQERHVKSIIKSAKSYDKLQKEINDYVKFIKGETSAVDENTKEIKKNTKAHNVNAGNVKKHGLQIGKLTKNFIIFKAVTVSINGVLLAFKQSIRGVTNEITTALNASMLYNQSLANIKAMSNMTSNELKDLDKFILKLAGSTIYTATEIANASMQLAKMGKSSKEIKAILPAMLNVAAGTMEDLGKTTTIVSNIMDQFGLHVEDTVEVSNTLSRAITTTKLTMSDLQIGFQYAGPIADQLGIDFGKLASMLSVLKDAGIKSSSSGRMLRKVLTDMYNPASKVNKYLKSIGVTGGTLSEKFKALYESGIDATKMQELFGVNAQTVATVLAKQSEEIDKNTKTFYDNEDAAKKMAETQINTLSGSIKIMLSQLETIRIKFGKMFEPASIKGVKLITSGFKSLNKIFDDNKDKIDDINKAFIGYINKIRIAFTPVIKNTVQQLIDLAQQFFNNKKLMDEIIFYISAIIRITPQLINVFILATKAVKDYFKNFTLLGIILRTVIQLEERLYKIRHKEDEQKSRFVKDIESLTIVETILEKMEKTDSSKEIKKLNKYMMEVIGLKAEYNKKTGKYTVLGMDADELLRKIDLIKNETKKLKNQKPIVIDVGGGGNDSTNNILNNTLTTLLNIKENLNPTLAQYIAFINAVHSGNKSLQTTTFNTMYFTGLSEYISKLEKQLSNFTMPEGDTTNSYLQKLVSIYQNALKGVDPEKSTKEFWDTYTVYFTKGIKKFKKVVEKDKNGKIKTKWVFDEKATVKAQQDMIDSFKQIAQLTKSNSSDIKKYSNIYSDALTKSSTSIKKMNDELYILYGGDQESLAIENRNKAFNIFVLQRQKLATSEEFIELQKNETFMKIWNQEYETRKKYVDAMNKEDERRQKYRKSMEYYSKYETNMNNKITGLSGDKYSSKNRLELAKTLNNKLIVEHQRLVELKKMTDEEYFEWYKNNQMRYDNETHQIKMDTAESWVDKTLEYSQQAFV